MSETVTLTLPIRRWQGEKATYHMVIIDGDAAEAITMHARLHRLEFGARRGFGSVKAMARVGGTEWKTSVFPSKPKRSGAGAAARDETEWCLLIGRKVLRAESLAAGDEAAVELDLL